MRVAFRTDASEVIGSGHVMRCVTLARKLREERADVLFVCRQHAGNMSAWIEAQGFPVAHLPAVKTDPGSTARPREWLGAEPAADAIATIDVMAERGFAADWIVVDHYGLDAAWETALRRDGRRIMVIDDLADRRHDCDLLLDQNLVAEFATRYDALVPPGAVKLLGPQYAMLQPEYASLHASALARKVPPRRILIYFGAMDDADLSGLALAAFLDLGRDEIAVDLVVGPLNKNRAALRERASGHANVTVHEHMPSLALLMLQADFAIGACGATSWERLCLQLPAIVVVLADNQAAIGAELHRRGLAHVLGRAGAVSAKEMRAAIAAEIAGNTARPSLDAARLVDGRGVDRVCSLLTTDRWTPLRVRGATAADEGLLLEWANDVQTRANSFDPRPITPHRHRGWLSARLARADRCHFYVVETEKGIPVGQVRLEAGESAWAVHYAIAPQLRGRGLGAPVLAAAIGDFAKIFPKATLVGEVIARNVASRRVFRSLGFSEREGNEIYQYERRASRD